LAAVVAMSGRTLPELFEPQPPLGGHLAPVEELEDFPLLIVHGLQDQVLPIDYGRDTQERFAPMPVQLMYKEYDIGHTISQESLDDITAWLTARLDLSTKSTFPGP
jgi:phospholipase/carboxylesterase